MGKALMKFIADLEGDDEQRVLRFLKKRTSVIRWPANLREEIAAGVAVIPIIPPREITAREREILDTHAAAVATLAEAREAWQTAIRDLEKASTSRPEGSVVDGYGRRELSPSQMGEVERLSASVGDLEDAYHAAAAAEVRARPANAGRRYRQPLSIRGLVGALFTGRPQ